MVEGGTVVVVVEGGTVVVVVEGGTVLVVEGGEVVVVVAAVTVSTASPVFAEPAKFVKTARNWSPLYATDPTME